MKKLIPDYSKEIDKIFIVSPINVRDYLFDEFEEFLKILICLCIEKNKGQKVVVICESEDSLKKTIDKLHEDKFYEDGKENFIEFVSIKVLDIWVRDFFSCANIDNENNLEVLKATYSPTYNTLAAIDDAAGNILAQKYFDNIFNIPLKLDGGNVISNSKYVFCSEKLYTENLNISKKEIDTFFEDNFEQKLITVPTELLDVVGHTDCILRFINEDTIALPIYDQEFKVDNRYVMNIKKLLTEKIGLDYKFVFLPSYLDDGINEDNIFSARGLYLNYFRFEDYIIFPSFEGLKYYEMEILKVFKNKFPEIKILFTPCDKISFCGGALNCITNVKYKI